MEAESDVRRRNLRCVTGVAVGVLRAQEGRVGEEEGVGGVAGESERVEDREVLRQARGAAGGALVIIVARDGEGARGRTFYVCS